MFCFIWFGFFLFQLVFLTFRVEIGEASAEARTTNDLHYTAAYHSKHEKCLHTKVSLCIVWKKKFTPFAYLTLANPTGWMVCTKIMRKRLIFSTHCKFLILNSFIFLFFDVSLDFIFHMENHCHRLHWSKRCNGLKQLSIRIQIMPCPKMTLSVYWKSVRFHFIGECHYSIALN